MSGSGVDFGNDPQALFSIEERAKLLTMLSLFAVGRTSILGTILVGSGAQGFRDRYSDIDVVYVCNESQFEESAQEIDRLLRHDLRCVATTNYQHRPDVRVSAALLPDGSEVDIGLWSVSVLFAAGPSWRIVQCRDARAGKLLDTAMRTNPRLERAQEPIVTGDDRLWQFVHAACVAKLRGDAAKLAQALEGVSGCLHESGSETLQDNFENVPELAAALRGVVARSRQPVPIARALLRLVAAL